MLKILRVFFIIALPSAIHTTQGSLETRDSVYVYKLSKESKDFFHKTVCALEQSTQLNVQPITAEEILENTWTDTAHTIVFPGAPTSYYIDELGQAGITVIKNAINASGINFLGICGGAVLGCAGNEYAISGFKVKRECGMLGFSPNRCKGPYKIVGTPTLIEISSKSRKVPVIYFGGSYFFTSRPEHIIATYSDKTVAILQPRDNVILCGPHPELEINESNAQEKQRKHFWHTLLARLTIPLQIE